MTPREPTDPPGPKQPSKRAQQRARREQAQADGQCTATARSSGNRCRNRPVEGRATCRKHGGTGGRPIVHGRYSELPGRVRSAFLASLADDSLFDHAQTVALMDSVVKETGALAAELDCPKFRARAVEMVELVEALLTMGKDASLSINALAQHLRRGASEVAAQERLFRLTERLDARIAEANRQKLAKQTAINAVDLVGVMQGVLATIQRLLAPELAKQVADEIEKLLGGVDAPIPAPARGELAASRN